MNILPFRHFITGIAVTILAFDLVEELRVPLTILSILAVLTVSIEALVSYRKSKKLEFQRVLDVYTSRHDLDISQSGSHAVG